MLPLFLTASAAWAVSTTDAAPLGARLALADASGAILALRVARDPREREDLQRLAALRLLDAQSRLQVDTRRAPANEVAFACGAYDALPTAVTREVGSPYLVCRDVKVPPDTQFSLLGTPAAYKEIRQWIR